MLSGYVRHGWHRCVVVVCLVLLFGMTTVIPAPTQATEVVPPHTQALPGQVYCPETVSIGSSAVCHFRASGYVGHTVYPLTYRGSIKGSPAVVVQPQTRWGSFVVQITGPLGGYVTVHGPPTTRTTYIGARP